MTSIFKLSGTDESKAAGSTAPGNSVQDAGTNWDNLRGLTKNGYQPQRSTKLRTALLAVLLVVGLGLPGFVLRNHMPALVSFGEELSETVHQLAKGSPTASTAARGTALPDVRSGRKQVRPSRTRVAESQSDQAYDPAFHPFYATVVVGGRRVALVSTNNIVVVDLDNGTWKASSELE